MNKMEKDMNENKEEVKNVNEDIQKSTSED